MFRQKHNPVRKFIETVLPAPPAQAPEGVRVADIGPVQRSYMPHVRTPTITPQGVDNTIHAAPLNDTMIPENVVPRFDGERIGRINPFRSSEYVAPPIYENMIPSRERFTARDVGPIDTPSEPRWLREEAKVRAPPVNVPSMPSDIREEAVYGVRVAPQDPDYIPPPVMNTVDPAIDYRPDVPNSDLVKMLGADIDTNQKKFELGDFDVTSSDFGSERFELMDGVSRFQQFGNSSGRTVK